MARSRKYKESVDVASGLPTRALRVGDIVITASDVNHAGTDNFFAWAERWWKDASQQLPLIGGEPDFEAEKARFIHASHDRFQQGDPVPMLVDARRVRTRSTARAVDQKIALPATLGRRTIAFAISGAQERGEGWDKDPNALVFFKQEGGAAALVTLQPFVANRQGIVDSAILEEALRRWKEIDQDTLDVLVHNFLQAATANMLTQRGWAYISFDSVLDARGVVKKSEVGKDGKRYTAGHRAEDRDEVYKSIVRLNNMGALLNPTDQEIRAGRRRRAPVIMIGEFDVNVKNKELVEGVWYTLGSWADSASETAILAPSEILTFHPERESLEKRLGRLLPILLGTSENPAGVASMKIGEVFAELHLRIDARNPGRTQSRFEAALNKLQDKKIIGGWWIDPDIHERPLPPRGFLDDWKARSLIVAPPATSPTSTATRR